NYPLWPNLSGLRMPATTYASVTVGSVPPSAISNWARDRAGAAWTHFEHALAVDPGHRATAGADRRHVDGGPDHGKLAHRVLGGMCHLTVDDRHVSARAANVERHQSAFTDQVAEIDAADHTRGRP